MTAKRQDETAKFSGRVHVLGLAVLIVVISGLVANVTPRADNDNFYSDIIRLDNVATKIHQSYVEEISSEVLVDKAVNGMMEALDPHTAFFKRKEYEELRIHTEGKFGGLGIQISIRDKILTVMTPISGTPAARSGIQSGDQIIKIESESTKGITIEEAVNKLRGEPGTDVTITVRRKGEARDLDYTITREIISIKSVPFYGMFDDKVGYVRLLAFSQDAGAEVEKAIRELMKEGITSLILDLRHNPGGLLPQANEVAEKFLPKGSLIVSTRGRVRTQNKDYKAAAKPVLPKDIPVVVLVSTASASASEIVAGAIQDWDRGVVLGDTTFGKGSVQSILPLDKDHHLKLTTAFYYTPSGRCINRPENDVPHEDEKENGSDTATTAADTTTYRTKGGRIVHGGGGIVPDTVIKPEELPVPVRALYLKDAFFKFANATYPNLKKSKMTIDRDFEVSPQLLNRFWAFLDTIDFTYETAATGQLTRFKQVVGLEKDTTVDSATTSESGKPNLGKQELASLEQTVSQVEGILETAAQNELSEASAEISKHIREAMLVREFGQDHEYVYREKLADDIQFQAALDLVRHKDQFASLLKPIKK